MTFGSLVPLALSLFLTALVGIGLHTRRFCQWCDYCGRYYWWIGWSAFEWLPPGGERWAMRCKRCRWLHRQLEE